MTENNDISTLSAELVKISTGAALQVGDMLVEAFEQGVTAKQKDGFQDLVTEYDHRAERQIAEHILKRHPDSTIIGEEKGERGHGKVQWFVDPIDGTTNFSSGFPFFCVSIGAAYEAQMLAGVIYDPLRQELFSASHAGAFLNNRPIRVNNTRRDATALLLTNYPNAANESRQQEHLRLGKLLRSFKAVRRMGSAALALAYAACGRADATLELGINPWDAAAGYLLVTQAGGKYVALDQDGAWEGERPWLAPGYFGVPSDFDIGQSLLNNFVTGWEA